VIFCPYHVGIYNQGVGAGPIRIADLGLISTIEKIGVAVHVREISPVDKFEGEIGKSFELLRRISNEVYQAKAAKLWAIVLSGNCMTTTDVVAGLDVSDLGCVWFDAHDDYNTPDTMTSGYLDGIGVSMLAGESFKAMMQTVPRFQAFDMQRFVFCGIRDVNDIEQRRVDDGPMQAVWGGMDRVINYAAELGNALDKNHTKSTMIYLDLDVLDDSYGRVNRISAPGGLFEDDLQDCLRTIASKSMPVSLTVASFDPALEGGNTIAKIGVRAISTTIQLLLASKELRKANSN
jgi:arginase